MICTSCGSGDTEVYDAEHDDENDVLHCYDCGEDEVIGR